ncbi:MAG: T9SS type A sorting domain-containing protein [Chitinophagales bacterium]
MSYFTKVISTLLLLLFALIIPKTGFAQPWTYNFGTAAGTTTHTSTTASTTFLPTPTNGTARVRVGTNPGSISLTNAGLTTLGSDAELQITSNTGSTSTTKFSIYDYVSAAKTGYVKFKMALASGTNGVYKFSFGDGATFSDNNAMTTGQVFAGIEWTLGSSNTVTYKVLNAGTYGTTGITGSTTLFTQSTSTVYEVEVYANDSTASVNYFRNGTSYSLANASWDLWVDGTRVGAGLASGGLGTNVIMDSYAFNHQNSVTTPGTLYLDDLEYANNLPRIYISDNGTQVAAANVNESTSNHILHKFKIDAVSGFSPNLTGITCTTAGGYDAADITNLKVRYSTDATLDGFDATLSTLSSPGAAGNKTFPSFTSQTITGGSTGYIFITADIAASSSSGGNTISLNAITTANLTFSSGIKTGATNAGGTQTIVAVCSNPTIGTNPTTPQTACVNVSKTYTVAATGGAPLTYQWQKSATGSGSWTGITDGTFGNYTYSGTTTVSLTTTSSAAGTEYYRCIVSSNGGCPVASDTGSYRVSDVPAQPGAISNSGTTVCQGQTGYTYSISAIANSTGYTWSYTGTGATITPSGTSATVDFSGSATSGNLQVTADNGCGSSTVRTLALTTTSCTNTITTTNASYGPFCNSSGNSISVAFSSVGTYTDSFYVQISDASGNFPVNSTSNRISNGSLTSPISATIPAAQAAGTGYRVRVVNPTPAIQSGNDNGSNITVTAATTPSVSIAITTGSNPMCAGASTTFTATPTNGGGSPTYQWKLNGSNIATGATYTTTTLAHNDSVTCVMTTSASCTTVPTATSSAITMTVNPIVTPAVSIAITTGTNPLCSGASTTFTATPTNGGGSPTYQWKLNGSNIATGVTYTTTTLADNDAVTCVMTTSANCPSSPTATSNTITITNNTPAQPSFTTSSSTAALGQTGVVYTVSNVAGVTYNWTYSGTGATITGSGNSVTVDFSTSATSGNISVTATKSGCTSTAATVAVTVSASNESNVADNTNYASGTPEFNINIDYISFLDGIPAKMIPMKIKIQDGGNDLADADKLNTVLAGIKFTVKDHLGANQLAQIKSAVLTTTAGTLIATASKVGTELVFSGMSGTNVTAVDVDNSGSGDKIIHLRVSFDSSQVIDNTKLVFQVSNVTAGASSSTFAASDGGAAQSDNSNANDRNRIEINATKLLFVQQPSTTSVSSTMSPSPSVRATDAYNRTDLDYATNISITSSGTMTGSPISVTPTSGVSTYGSVVHTVAGTGLTLTATSGSLTSATSGTFDITTYVNGDWYSITGTGLTWNTGSNWQQVIGGTLSAPGGGNGNGGVAYPNGGTPAPVVHILGTMTTNGSRSAGQLIIEPGGNLTTTSGACTFTNLLVKSGGTMTMSNLITIGSSGVLEVEDSATFVYAYTNSNSRSTSIWNGTENFHPYSNFVITQAQNTAGFLIIEDKDDIDANTYNGFTACFGNISVERAAGTGALGLFPSGFVKNLTHGNLVFKSSTSDMRFADAGSGFTSTIGGRFIIESGFGSNNISFSNSAITGTLTVRGNLIHNGTGSLRLCSSTTTTNITLNVDSSMSVTNTGNFSFNASNGSTHTAILNLKGDLTVASGAYITNASTSVKGSLNFKGIGDGSTADLTQVVNIASTNAARNQYINFNICKDAYVQLGANLDLGTNAKVTDSSGGTLDFGFSGSTPLNITMYASGAAFESRQGSTLKITSAAGLYDEWATYSGAGVTINTGNVQGIISGNRSISPIAKFWYIGKGDQKTGDAPNVSLSSLADAKVVICDLSSKSDTLKPTVSFGVTSGTTVDTATGGKLDIRRGNFVETETEYVFGSTGTLYMAPGTLYKIYKGSSDSLSSDNDQIPRMTGGTYQYVLTGGTIELAGSGSNHAFQTVRSTLGGRPYYKYLKFSGANTYKTNYKNPGSQTGIDSALIITGSAVVDCRTLSNAAASFIGNGGLIMDGGRLRLKNTSNTQPELVGDNVAYNITGGTVEFYGTSATQQQQMRGNYTSLVTKPKITYYDVDINAAAANWSTTNTFQDAGNVDMNSSFNIRGTLNVYAPAVFRMDDQEFIDSSGKVQVNDYAGLLYANTGGINATGTTGNIRTSATDVFSSKASYGFVGPNDMSTGSGLPATTNGLYVYKSNAAKKITLTNTVRADSILKMNSGHILAVSPIYIELGVDASNKGTLSYTSGYVLGKMRRWYSSTNSGIASGLFPLGQDVSGVFKNRHYYIQYTNAATTGGYLDVNFNPVAMGLSGIPILGIPAVGSCASSFDVTSTEDQGYWIGTPQTSTLSDGDYTLALTGESFVTVTDLCQLTLLKRVGAGSWTAPGTHLQPTGSPSVPTVSRSGISGFSNFGFGGGPPNPLPVELTRFVGNCNDAYVKLEWTTASEKNSKVFMVERSSDGIHFATIGYVNAAGFSSTIKNYTFIDSTSSSENYYRLVEIDHDDSYQSFHIIKVNCNGNGVDGTNIFYTPINGIEIETYATQSKEMLFNVYEVSGKLLYQETKQIAQGYNKFSLELKNKLANGIYIVRAIDGSKSSSTKIWIH